MSSEGVVLVIGCGMQPYREYLLASAAGRHPLWMFNPTELTWQRDYVCAGTVVDTMDRPAVLAAARELAGRTPVRGVLSWDEALIVTTAHVADELGLPGATLDGIEGCRDKVRGRRVLSAAGIAQPGFEFVHDEDAAVAAADRLGYPVVVKPRGMGASIGVVLAVDPYAVREAYRSADASSRHGAVAYHGGALVEEYLPGPEISVDGSIVDGRYRPLFVARKMVGMYPYFEELGHIVDSADELLDDPAVLDTLARAHTAIGFRYGVTHTELKLTDRGPIIVEINGRLAGDLIPRLARYASGIEPGAVAVEVSLGLEPGVPVPSTRRCVGVRFAYPPQDCVVESVAVPDTGVLAAAALVGPGTRMQLPPAEFISRHAYVICAGEDRDSCATRLDQAITDVHLSARALEPAAATAVAGA